jgi:hypothetical protein
MEGELNGGSTENIKILPNSIQFNSKYILLEIYEDTEKYLKFYAIFNENKLYIFTISTHTEVLKFNEKLIFSLKFENFLEPEKYFNYCIYLNKIYVATSPNLVQMIDFQTKKLHNIEIPSEDNSPTEICKNHSYVLVGTKLVFTGGITKENQLNKDISSFDISLYTFQNEKIKENNMIARHSHGSVNINDIIYIIGGFTSVEETEDKVCNTIQAIRFDNILNKWREVAIQGSQPELLIKPQIKYDQEHLFCYSNYLYPKLWYLILKTSTGFMVDLTKEEVPYLENTIFSYIKDEKLDEEKNLKKYAYSEILYMEEDRLIPNMYRFRLDLNY